MSAYIGLWLQYDGYEHILIYNFNLKTNNKISEYIDSI